MDILTLVALVVSLVALMVAAFAFAQDWFAFQNPVLRAHLIEPYGETHRDKHSTAWGPRGWIMSVSLFGQGAAFLPRVKVDREAPSPVAIRWSIERQDPLLTASGGEVTIVIDQQVKHDGLWVVVSYDVPRRLRRGTKRRHVRFSVPPNGRGAQTLTQVFALGKWRQQRSSKVSEPPLSSEIPPSRGVATDEV